MGANRYLALNKPYGVMSSFTDPGGRPTLKQYIQVEGVYAAGRLDLDSEGLLILSDDGAFMHRLTDPRQHLPKTYFVQIEGIVTDEALASLASGVVIHGFRTRRCLVMEMPDPKLPERGKPITPHGPTAWLRMVLEEGKKRQIRHMTAAVGLPSLRIFRYAIGPVSVEGLAAGEWRALTAAELAAINSGR